MDITVREENRMMGTGKGENGVLQHSLSNLLTADTTRGQKRAGTSHGVAGLQNVDSSRVSIPVFSTAAVYRRGPDKE